MANASRRLASVVVGTVLTLVGGVAGQVGTAAAADPIASAAAPTLLAPMDDPTGVNELKDVVLEWSPVAHADSYEVQVSPNGDWTNNRVELPDNGVTVNTTYEMPLSLPHAFYYWRVRGVHGTAHSPWSSTRTFLREWYAPFEMLQVPTGTNPTLAWQPVPHASLYRVRFSDRSDFANKGNTFTCYTQETTFTPYATNMAGAERMEAGGCFDEQALTDGMTYFWELIAFDDSTDGVIVADTANDAGWECAETQPECDAYMPHRTSATPTFTFQAPDAGNFAGTAPTGLTTSWHAATAAQTDCTGGGTTCPMTPTFSWAPVDGANYYEVHIWRDPRLTNTYRVYDTAYTSLTPREGFFDAQAGTPYYWSVAAGTCKDSVSKPNCAAAGAVTTAPSPVTCPAASSATAPTITDMSASPAGPNGPQSAAAGQSTTVSLTGTGFLAGACVAADNSGGVISNVTVVDDQHLTFKYKPADSTMSVTFTVVNTDGGRSGQSAPLDVFAPPTPDREVLGAFSALGTFKKRSGAVELLTPADGATINDDNVTFSWTDFLSTGGQGGYDVRNYRLQVSGDADFDDSDIVWDNANIDMTQYTNPTLRLPDGIWYWRVQGIDESDLDLTWSATRMFVRDRTTPQLSLQSANGMAVNRAVTIASTEPVSGMTTRNVHLLPATGGGAVSGTLSRTGTQTWKFRPSVKLATGQVYRLSVSQGVRDSAGNPASVTGAGVRTATAADDNGPALSFQGAWSKHQSSQALGGTFRSTRRGHSVTVTVAGARVKVFGCRGPSFGALSVIVDGAHKARVNEHLSYTKCGVTLWKSRLDQHAAHTVKLVAATGTANVDQVRVG